MNIARLTNDLLLFTGIILLYVCRGFDVSLLSFFVFISIYLLLFVRSSVYSFVFAFLYSINLTIGPLFTWDAWVPILAMMAPVIREKGDLSIIKEQPKVKFILAASALFFVYVFFINLLWKGVTVTQSLQYLYFYGGFLVFIPAYYITLRYRHTFFRLLITSAILFLIIYYANMLFNLGWINIRKSYRADEDVNINMFRFMYDIRQFVIVFAYLIPAVLFMTISKKNKMLLIGVGVFAYLVIIFAIYRLAIFYVFMGILTSLFLISKYINLSKLIKRASIAAIFLFVVLSLFSSSLGQYVNLYQWTINSFMGGSSDSSAEARFLFQMPILLGLFNNNPLTGAGLHLLWSYQNEEMYGYVDYPILGTLSAFGIIGMIIYYSRFFAIIPLKLKNVIKNSIDSGLYKNEALIILALQAYFITMITYRIFYISWELTYGYQQIEFGLFVGIYFALQSIVKKGNTLNLKST